jgi:hypothetical protein
MSVLALQQYEQIPGGNNYSDKFQLARLVKPST